MRVSGCKVIDGYQLGERANSCSYMTSRNRVAAATLVFIALITKLPKTFEA